MRMFVFIELETARESSASTLSISVLWLNGMTPLLPRSLVAKSPDSLSLAMGALFFKSAQDIFLNRLAPPSLSLPLEKERCLFPPMVFYPLCGHVWYYNNCHSCFNCKPLCANLLLPRLP